MSDASSSTPDVSTSAIETDYTVGQDNIQRQIGRLGFDIHNPVFVISGLSIVAFVLVTLMFQQEATAFFGWLRPFLTSTFDWFFLSAANVFVVFCIVLMVTPLGKIRLGGADAKPPSMVGVYWRSQGGRSTALRVRGWH